MNVSARMFAFITLMVVCVANAEDFTVTARVLCPVYERSASYSGVSDAIFDPNMNSPTSYGCPQIKVKAYDTDLGPDQYCGQAYTNLSGEVSFSASCGDIFWAGKPDVYLRIVPQSPLGYKINIHDKLEAYLRLGVSAASIIADPFIGAAILTSQILPAITATQEYRIEESSDQKHPSDGSTLEFGNKSIYTTGSPFKRRMNVIAAYFILNDQTFRALKAIAQHPMYTKWVIDSWLGSPTTIWDAIIVDDEKRDSDTTAKHVVKATPHELGHILHNQYHSGEAHWLVSDGPDYMNHHCKCSNISRKFAWYEGFANFSRDFVFNNAATLTNLLDNYAPFVPGQPNRRQPTNATAINISAWEPFTLSDMSAGSCTVGGNTYTCSNFGTDREGNVQAFLNYLYYGHLTTKRELSGSSLVKANDTYQSALSPSTLVPVTDASGASIGKCVTRTMRAKTIFELVDVTEQLKSQGAIADNHELPDYWLTVENKDYCGGNQYCGSPSFKIQVASILTVDEHPDWTDCEGNRIVASASRGLRDRFARRAQEQQQIVARRASTQVQDRFRDIILADTRLARLQEKLQGSHKRWLERLPKKVEFRASGLNRWRDAVEYGVGGEFAADNVDLIRERTTEKAMSTLPAYIVDAFERESLQRTGRESTDRDVAAAVDRANAGIEQLNDLIFQNHKSIARLERKKDILALEKFEKELGQKIDFGFGVEQPVIKVEKALDDAERQKVEETLGKALINAYFEGK